MHFIQRLKLQKCAKHIDRLSELVKMKAFALSESLEERKVEISKKIYTEIFVA